jgi:hypothetical protein
VAGGGRIGSVLVLGAMDGMTQDKTKPKTEKQKAESKKLKG